MKDIICVDKYNGVITVEVTVKNYRFLLEIKKSNIIQRVEA